MVEGGPSYELHELLDSDGADDVWRGVEVASGREVAIKLFPRFRLEGTRIEATTRRAVEALEGVGLRRAPALLGVKREGPFFGVVSEFVAERSLAQILTPGRAMSPLQALWVMAQATCPVSTAMERGVLQPCMDIHDIRMSSAGEVTILGLGTRLSAEDRRLLNGMGSSPRHRSVVYMAPECVSGGAFEATSAVYTLGALLYHLVVGEAPFEGGSIFSLMTRVVNEAPRPPRAVDASIPREVEALILGAMSARPEDRPGSPAVFLTALIEVMASLEVMSSTPNRALTDLRRFIYEDDTLAIVRVLAAWPELGLDASVRDYLGTHVGVALLRRVREGKVVQDPDWRLLPFMPQIWRELEALSRDEGLAQEARAEASRALLRASTLSTAWLRFQ